MHSPRLYLASICSLFAATAGFSAQPVTSLTGWHQFRGPNRDGISMEKGLLKSWPAEGPKLLWEIKGAGAGMGSATVGGGKIFVIGNRKEGASLTAFDLSTQKEVWSTVVSEKRDQPNGAPTFDGERVYAVSKDGVLICCDAATGKEQWKKNYTADLGGQMMSGWGYSESPLIDGDLVIAVPGGNDAIMVALNKNTGAVKWKAPMPSDVGTRGKDGAGYTGAVISNGGGVKQYISLVGRGLVGVRASDGKTLWTYNPVANGTANIPTPLVWDDYVFTSSGYGTGAALLQLKKQGDGVIAEEKYFLKAATFQNHHGGMVRIGDYIYAGRGHNNGIPVCLGWKTGKIVWEQSERPGRESAAVISADGELYFRWQDGAMGLLEASPSGYKLLGSFKLPDVKGPSWPHPSIHDKKLLVRAQDQIFCYDLAAK
jgi:outer membrane protein assembly factor BamB